MTDQLGTTLVDEQRAKRLTRALASMRFATSFAFGAGSTVRFLHMESLELSVASIGVIMAGYSLVIAIVEIPSGAVADVWGRRKTKLLASWVMVGAYLVLAAATEVGHVVISAVLLGIGRALFSGAADSWFVDEIGDPKHPRVLAGLARAEAGHNLGHGLGALTGGLAPLLWVDDVEGRLVFAPIFVLGALMLIGDLWITWRQMIETRTPTRMSIGGVWRTTLAGVGNALDAPGPRWTAFAMMSVGGAVACIELLTPLSLSEGVGTESALVVFGPLIAGAWLFSAVASLLTERVERFVGSVQRSSGLLMFVLVAALVPAALDEWYFVVPAYVGVNFVLGALMPLLAAALHQHVRSSNRSAAASTLSLSLMIGAAGGSVLIGGLGTLAVLVVAAAAMTTAVALIILPTPQSGAD